MRGLKDDIKKELRVLGPTTLEQTMNWVEMVDKKFGVTSRLGRKFGPNFIKTLSRTTKTNPNPNSNYTQTQSSSNQKWNQTTIPTFNSRFCENQKTGKDGNEGGAVVTFNPKVDLETV